MTWILLTAGLIAAWYDHASWVFFLGAAVINDMGLLE